MSLNKRKTSKPAGQRNLVTFSHPDSIISEQFRTIRTNIQFINGEKNNPILLITSPSKLEGKSTSAANIAVSMAQQKEKVLLIDASLRNPAIHEIFQLPHTAGLTDVLKGYITFEEAVVSSQIPGLKILPSGKVPTNPSELLSSKAMKRLLDKVSPLYDITLIDSPSVLDVTDTKILANLSDGVILVVRQGKTKAEHTYNAKRVLQYAKSQIIGVILNEQNK
ncbi:CpsD/CapB family tyrosine-protein kinase [Cytobacillus purgationiresistens]|uniref:non-specific protein-tyrosine kinase n=1 Tax=Cytobacillus purgationiresistens TaxID=863449 RepID=A0ABU0AJN8_9BACI|nr:CpsD/CapB family tyrosine-protein kinase [Cytobacillus purgationiresistens]MDQ0270921.1 protein-tyrosine kinase [Cytobacillus purgationiresistens]